MGEPRRRGTSESLLSENDYVASVVQVASTYGSDAIAQIFNHPPAVEPKICYRDSESGKERFINSAKELIQQAEKDHMARNHAVCIIENISPACIRMLGPGLSLNPGFFADHAKHADEDRFWKQHTAWSYGPGHDITAAASSQSTHVDGMFEYHDLVRGTSELTSSPNIFPRACFEQDPYPIQSSTRMSYYRVNPYLYLFLVDAPLALKDCSKVRKSRSRTTLRLLYSTNRGGLLLPQLFSQQSYSLLESLRSVFQHSWHFRLMFNDIPGVLPAHAMLYMLSSSLWETNFRFLDSDIKRISFRDLRDPKDSTNDELHNRREDLEYLQTFVAETVKWVPPALSDYFASLPDYQGPEVSTFHQPMVNLEQILVEAEKLQSFLMDTFQLLMSSLSVRDSKLSIKQAEHSAKQAELSSEQARRSAWLTQLASFYLPLSVLTGIFGMNLKEINDSHVPFWWCLVMLVILSICTVAIYFILRGFAKWKQERADRKRRVAKV